MPVQGGERAPSDSFRCPAHRFAAIDHAVNQLLESLSSSHHQLVAAALSALTNLTNPDDLREHLRLDARVRPLLMPVSVGSDQLMCFQPFGYFSLQLQITTCRACRTRACTLSMGKCRTLHFNLPIHHGRWLHQAYREGPEVLQQKLMNLMGWQPLGQRGKDAARLLYHRLEARGSTGLANAFFTGILPPAALPAAAPSP